MPYFGLSISTPSIKSKNNGLSIRVDSVKSRNYGLSVKTDSVRSINYGLSVKIDSVKSKNYGLAITIPFDLIVRIINGVGSSIDTRLELYQGSQLLDSKESVNGIVKFPLGKAGFYQIKAINSDFKMIISYDGINTLSETYSFLNKTIVYRIMNQSQNCYSKELTIRV
ncbi:hypothetical protein [Reichenbachiella versicolor]|uniref:hypothetical protein n=1 Tax=Reichenbachiella versicolor TaxID=1821036 RepID=UPI000D6E5305|nr:hypothetical protein [Reichenbachiella versicolor]